LNKKQRNKYLCVNKVQHTICIQDVNNNMSPSQHNVNKADLIIISLKINLFSPWYGWKISELALNNNHSLDYLDIFIIARKEYICSGFCWFLLCSLVYIRLKSVTCHRVVFVGVPLVCDLIPSCPCTCSECFRRLRAYLITKNFVSTSPACSNINPHNLFISQVV
jgi:hypothetical protein